MLCFKVCTKCITRLICTLDSCVMTSQSLHEMYYAFDLCFGLVCDDQ